MYGRGSVLRGARPRLAWYDSRGGGDSEPESRTLGTQPTFAASFIKGATGTATLSGTECQFSYYCDGKPERPAEQDAWTMARDIATLLTSTDVNVAGIEDATHYHAVGTQPSWTTALERRKQIELCDSGDKAPDEWFQPAQEFFNRIKEA